MFRKLYSNKSGSKNKWTNATASIAPQRGALKTYKILLKPVRGRTSHPSKKKKQGAKGRLDRRKNRIKKLRRMILRIGKAWAVRLYLYPPMTSHSSMSRPRR